MDNRVDLLYVSWCITDRGFEVDRKVQTIFLTLDIFLRFDSSLIHFIRLNSKKAIECIKKRNAAMWDREFAQFVKKGYPRS